MIKYISQLKTRNLGKLTKSILKYYHIEYNNTMVLSSVVKNKIKIDINEDNFKTFYLRIPENEYIDYPNRRNGNWSCNIQQIKIKDIDHVIFALYFKDMVCYYKLSKPEIIILDNFMPYQHKDNKNECQFMVAQNNIDKFDRYKILSIKYDDLFLKI